MGPNQSRIPRKNRFAIVKQISLLFLTRDLNFIFLFLVKYENNFHRNFVVREQHTNDIDMRYEEITVVSGNVPCIASMASYYPRNNKNEAKFPVSKSIMLRTVLACLVSSVYSIQIKLCFCKARGGRSLK